MVDEHRIGANFGEDTVERDGVNPKVLSKEMVELLAVLVGGENEG